MRKIFQALAAAAVLVSQPAMGQWRFDPSQLPLLPPYCKHAQGYSRVVPGGNEPAQIARWDSAMGKENFMHMHHYCWALENTNRGLYASRTKHERDSYLGASLTDFDYVIRNVSADFVLLPEILTKRAENLIRIGRGPDAVGDLIRAMELKPDYWPPYAALSDYYKNLGDTGAAKAWLAKGLAASPNAKPLKRRLQKLDSKSASQ